MKVKEIYEFAVKLGIKKDPRGEKTVAKNLREEKKRFESLKGLEKELYDKDRLFNPYVDSRVLYDNGKVVKRVLAGIDIETAEILLADRLTEKGKRIDLVISHHPEGKAYAALSEVMEMQADIAHSFGVPINKAENFLATRISEVARKVHPANHNRAIDTARILGINLLSIHTPADNQVHDYLQNLFEKEKPEKVKDIIDLLEKIPEYKKAAEESAGPTIFVGSKDRRAGRIMVDMTGGTGGAKENYKELANAGVGTVVGMHISDEKRKIAEENQMNIVIAGHISSDSIGMNLILDKLEEKGIEIIPCSGLIRVKR